jgi:hypothetical protein
MAADIGAICVIGGSQFLPTIRHPHLRNLRYLRFLLVLHLSNVEHRTSNVERHDGVSSST